MDAIARKMAARNFLPRCTACANRIPIESIRIRNLNALHLGKKYSLLLAAIFSAIVYGLAEQDSKKKPREDPESNKSTTKDDSYLERRNDLPPATI